MSKKRYEWVFENGENEIIDNLAGRYVTISSPELLNEKDEKISDLEAKLAESEEKKESYRLQNDEHHLQLLQFYSRLGVEAFGADIHEKALETLMIMKEELEEKNGVRRALSACNRQNDEFADMIKKLVSEKEELKQQLAEKDKAIEELKQQLFESGLKTLEEIKLSEQRKKMLEGLSAENWELRQKLNQEKISFAVEQLEKVKELLYPELRFDYSLYLRVMHEIDNQIKAIKGEK